MHQHCNLRVRFKTASNAQTVKHNLTVLVINQQKQQGESIKTLIFQSINLPSKAKHLDPCFVYGRHIRLAEMSVLSMAGERAGWLPSADGQAVLVPIFQ